MNDNPQLWTDDELWQVLNDNVKDFGIFMIDPEGRIATWNSGAERVLGFSADEILGDTYGRIFTPEDIEKDQPEFELREAREKGRSEDERWHLRRNETRFWASGVVTPLWTADGELRGYAKIVRDITQRKMAELAAVEANRIKDEFLAILSHEFRNPLGAILNATQLLTMDQADDEIVRQAAAVVERQAQGLVRMVDDLLDISRINSGKLLLQRERVELGEVLNHALESAQPMISTRNHQCTLSMPPAAIWLEGDRQRLAQIFANLIVNAAKYTDPSGEISIAVTQEGQQVVVRVKDNGAGILSEMLPRIFEPFVQADRSHDRTHGGLGIGLTFVKRVVEMHGGIVEAFSEGIGHGSEFTVRLHAVAEIETPQAGDAPAAMSETGTRRLRILVADDNHDTAETLAMLLRKVGYETTTVDSGPAALQWAADEHPDVMIIDIGLPGMDGFEVARRIRSQESSKAIRLVAATGYAQAEDRDRALQAGFDHHLPKPIDFKVLMELLKEAEAQLKR
ncbi:MAG: ATP-binding protein [Planctomycetaceae bacterium]